MSDLTMTTVTAKLRSAGCVFAEEEAALLVAEAASGAELAGMLQRRINGLPLEQVVGWAEFCGLRIVVDPGVFVPRRRTAFMVRKAVELHRRSPVSGRAPVIVDLCCGSGAVGVAVAAALPVAELHAADIDPVAVRCARRNVVPAGGQVWAGDLYGALPESLRARVGILLVNAPYVPTGAMELMPAEARLYESRVALDGGADGLDVQRRVILEAEQWLAPDGFLLIETSERQARMTMNLMTSSGLAARITASEELDATVVVGGVSKVSRR